MSGKSSFGGKAVVVDDAEWVLLPCECGHPKAAHEGHTHPVGSPEPTCCSQGCGCKEYRPKRASKGGIVLP